MINFISADDTNRRIAQQNKEAIEKAVNDVNKLIREADNFPVIVPRSLFPDQPSVKYELFRKLREESGWVVEERGPAPVPVKPDEIQLPGKYYYLYHKGMRREEQSK